MERTGIQVENEKSRPILTAKNICVLVYVLTPNNETGGSGEEPPVSSILESNSAKLRAKNSVLQSKMNNLCQISRQIFRRSFSRNSARYKTFMFLCQVPRLCQIDRLPCTGGTCRFTGGFYTHALASSQRRAAVALSACTNWVQNGAENDT